MSYAFKSDIGKVRERNEDSTIVVTNRHGDILMMVFDGMGGHNKGDLASNLAQNYMIKNFKSSHFFFNFQVDNWLKKMIRSCNSFLYKYTEMEKMVKGMGTTFSCFLIHKKIVSYAYVGDSRCYVIKGNDIIQVSEDETYVNMLYKQGKITKEEMASHPKKNVITNALGCYNIIGINVKRLFLPFDGLLVCSDGLYNMVDNTEILKTIQENNSPEIIVNRLIDKANKNGGVDNIAICYYERG